MADTFQYLIGSALSFPPASAGVSITPSGTAFADSAWVEIIAAASEDLSVRGLVLEAPGTTARIDVEVDVGVGSAGSEVVVTTFRIKVNATLDLWGGTAFWSHPILGRYIASGDRVALRMRKGGTDTNPWTWGLCCVGAFTGTALTTTQPQKAIPAAVASVTVTSAFAVWTYGGWTELLAAAWADLVLTGVNIYADGFFAWEVELGVGSAGSEMPITKLRGTESGGGVGGADMYIPFFNPLNAIANGSRVSARMRQHQNAPNNCTVSLTCVEQPV